MEKYFGPIAHVRVWKFTAVSDKFDKFVRYVAADGASDASSAFLSQYGDSVTSFSAEDLGPIEISKGALGLIAKDQELKRHA